VDSSGSSPFGASVDAFIALGANLGERIEQIRSAVERLAAHPAIEVRATSPVYESEAHTLDDGEEQPPYLNAVAHVRTTLAPEALLGVCQRIERAAGRTRDRRWAPRQLDLDLLMVGRITRRTERLTLPHPRLAERRFVLQPWADIAPNLYVPAPFENTVAALLERCPDTADLALTDHVLDPTA
jgi:2-amino-4-hydroxy-6-hydroxymethyldihydropteridine diphosphokinase